MKIKVRELVEGCMPRIIQKGDWIDLKAAVTVNLQAPQSGVLKKSKDGNYRNVESEVTTIPLGVAMQLPKGFEAYVLPRSSTPRRLGVMVANSMGIIDNSFLGDKDEWGLPVVPLRETTIEKGTRIAQFRIQLNQKATILQKLKWLFSNKIELVKVDNLSSEERGGFGSTGK